MKQFQKCLFITGLFFLILGCQKDDICPPGTETTPRLVIEFYDAEDPSRLKAVQGLVVQATGKEEILLGPVTTNSITIPLRTDENFTEYSFTRTGTSNDGNSDTITFTYSPTLDYLNRACGYKVDFLNMDVAIHDDSDNWILGDIILQENVENETAVHISLTH